MWTVLEIIASLALILVFMTEFFWPLIKGKPLFGSFRKLKNTGPTPSDEASLDDKIAKAKIKAEEIKNTQNEVSENLKSAEQLKAEADNLLK